MKKSNNELKEMRVWGEVAYERLLNKALRKLEEDFNKWRAGKLDPFELSDRIHKFHNGISRDLYVAAEYQHGLNILLEGPVA